MKYTLQALIVCLGCTAAELAFAQESIRTGVAPIQIINPNTGSSTVKYVSLELHSSNVEYANPFSLKTSQGRAIFYIVVTSGNFTTTEKSWLDVEFERQNGADGFTSANRLMSSDAAYDCFAFAFYLKSNMRLHEITVERIESDDFYAVSAPSASDYENRVAVGCSGMSLTPEHAAIVVTELIPFWGTLVPIPYAVAKNGFFGMYKTSVSGLVHTYGLGIPLNYFKKK